MKLSSPLRSLAICLLMGTIKAQSLQMPVCLDSCITDFPANHESDTCTEEWIASLSSCIDSACPSTSTSLIDQTTGNNTMEFVPMSQYSCEQSDVPGFTDTPPPTTLVLRAGLCVDSPYTFLSFVSSMNDSTALECGVQLFSDDRCVGAVTNMSVVAGNLISGECSFDGGKSVRMECNSTQGNVSDNTAAHIYLDGICSSHGTSGVDAPMSLASMIPSPMAISNATTSITANMTGAASGPKSSSTVAGNTTAPASPLISPPMGSHFSEGSKVVIQSGFGVALLIALVVALQA